MSSTTCSTSKARDLKYPQLVDSKPQKWSLCTKLSLFVLGSTALATTVALYVLGQDEDNPTAVSGENAGLKLAGLGGLLLAGKALLIDQFSRENLPRDVHRFDSSSDVDPNPLEGIKKRAIQLNKFTSSNPPPKLQYDEHEGLETQQSNSGYGSNENQKAIRRSPTQQQTPDLSNRYLMYPSGDEYLVDNATIVSSPVSVGYDSIILNNNNVAYVLKEGRNIYAKVVDTNGTTVKNKFLASGSNGCTRYSNSACYNPEIKHHQGNIVFTWGDGGDLATKMLVLNPADWSALPVFSFKLCQDTSLMNYCLSLTQEMSNGHLAIFSMQNGDKPAFPPQMSNVIVDSNYAAYGGYNFLPISPLSLNRTMAVGAFTDSSLITFYEQIPSTVTNLLGQDWNSWGWYQGGPSFLEQCFAPKAISLTNNLVFVSCIQPDGELQAFAIDQQHEKVVPKFTIASGIFGGFAAHDLAFAESPKLLFSHYLSNNNTFFSVYDEYGARQGSPLQSSTSPGITSPTLAAADDGNLVTTFLRNGMLYSRSFILNTPPELMIPLGPKNASVNTFFMFQIPPGAWSDRDGHSFVVNASLPVENSSWLQFIQSNNTFLGTPRSGDQGVWESSVFADDGFFNGITTTALDINVLNRNPILSTPPAGMVYVNSQYTVQLNAFDPDGDDITFSAPLPTGATLTKTGLFNWRPLSGQQGNYQIPILVKDDFGGNITETMLVQVPNRAPKPSIIDPRNFTENVFGTFNLLPFIDEDGDPITYTAFQVDLGRLPDWSAFANLLFSGTPSSEDRGPLLMNFSGSDDFGGLGSVLGDFHVIEKESFHQSQIPAITFASGVIGITLTLFGCLYKTWEKRIHACYARNIQPCTVSTTRKIQACLPSRLWGTTPHTTVPTTRTGGINLSPLHNKDEEVV